MKLVRSVGAQLLAAWRLLLRAVLNLNSPVVRWEMKVCFHHDHRPGWEPGKSKSWIRSRIVDAGRTKLYWCERCGAAWTLGELETVHSGKHALPPVPPGGMDP